MPNVLKARIVMKNQTLRKKIQIFTQSSRGLASTLVAKQFVLYCSNVLGAGWPHGLVGWWVGGLVHTNTALNCSLDAHCSAPSSRVPGAGVSPIYTLLNPASTAGPAIYQAPASQAIQSAHINHEEIL